MTKKLMLLMMCCAVAMALRIDIASAGAGALPASRDLTRLDQFLTRVATELPLGLEVLIVQNGQQIYWKQFGRWQKNHRVAIASGTKWYSGAVIMSLVDDGIVSLDDPASKFLPYMKGEKTTITIRQLMSHTAGFAGEQPAAHPCMNDARDTLAHCAEALANVPLTAPPGTAFIYAGADMQIAGRVAEVATGKDWQTLFRERIAAPLGLTATDYEWKGPTRNPRISGGGRSTVSDYMNFLTMIEQHGMYEGHRVLSARAVEVMLSDQTGGAPIVESPFRRPGLANPRGGNNRYGIGCWLEEPDARGHWTLNSSPGAFGWAPYIDSTHNLQVVVGVLSLRKFQPHYAEMKNLIRELTH